MNKTIKIILSVLVVACAVAVGVYVDQIGRPSEKVGFVPPVNTAITHFTSTIYAGGDIIEGGGVYATSSPGSTDQLTETEFIPDNSILVTPTVQSVTLSFPASFTNTLANVGDAVTTFIQNGTTTAGINITLSPVTGSAPNTTITMATTSLVIHPQETVETNCTRLSAATTTCFVY